MGQLKLDLTLLGLDYDSGDRLVRNRQSASIYAPSPPVLPQDRPRDSSPDDESHSASKPPAPPGIPPTGQAQAPFNALLSGPTPELSPPTGSSQKRSYDDIQPEHIGANSSRKRQKLIIASASIKRGLRSSPLWRYGPDLSTTKSKQRWQRVFATMRQNDDVEEGWDG